jgi:hypothetical protein
MIEVQRQALGLPPKDAPTPARDTNVSSGEIIA